MIGYKMWGALLARALMVVGIVVVIPDIQSILCQTGVGELDFLVIFLSLPGDVHETEIGEKGQKWGEMNKGDFDTKNGPNE